MLFEGAIGFKPTLAVDTGFLANVKKTKTTHPPDSSIWISHHLHGYN